MSLSIVNSFDLLYIRADTRVLLAQNVVTHSIHVAMILYVRILNV